MWRPAPNRQASVLIGHRRAAAPHFLRQSLLPSLSCVGSHERTPAWLVFRWSIHGGWSRRPGRPGTCGHWQGLCVQQ